MIGKLFQTLLSDNTEYKVNKDSIELLERDLYIIDWLNRESKAEEKLNIPDLNNIELNKLRIENMYRLLMNCTSWLFENDKLGITIKEMHEYIESDEKVVLEAIIKKHLVPLTSD